MVNSKKFNDNVHDIACHPFLHIMSHNNNPIKSCNYHNPWRDSNPERKREIKQIEQHRVEIEARTILAPHSCSPFLNMRPIVAERTSCGIL